MRISEFLRILSLPSLRKSSGNGCRSCGRINAGRQKQEEPAFSPAFSTAPTAGAKLYFCTCNTYKDDSQNHFCMLQLQEQHRLLQNPLYPGTGALPDRAETIQRTLVYVRMFRKDFKMEMLAQDEESRKAELWRKSRKPSPGRRSGWRI